MKDNSEGVISFYVVCTLYQHYDLLGKEEDISDSIGKIDDFFDRSIVEEF